MAAYEEELEREGKSRFQGPGSGMEKRARHQPRRPLSLWFCSSRVGPAPRAESAGLCRGGAEARARLWAGA